ncbi:amine oxidase, partial [Plakobranchus ocellatus]
LNIDKPNSKFHTSIIAMAQVPDNVHNLQTLVNRFKEQIKTLKVATWNGRKICIFLCGDYHFLADVHGISGSSGTHPCLWCLQTKKEINCPRDPENPPEPRTDKKMKEDFTLFSNVGENNLSKAKHYNNVIRSPMLPLSIIHTAVPYLHILLGVVKKHHQLLEFQCDRIDREIAADMAQNKTDTELLPPNYGAYIQTLRKIEKLEEKKRLEETKLVFLDESLSVWQYYRRTRLLEKRIDKLEKKIDNAKSVAKPYIARCGPVCSNLDTVLKTHKITIQAYHGRSFTGNHSQKYIQPSINEAICSSILSKTQENTKQQKIINYAVQVKETFHHANTLYHKIHKAISHSRPIERHEINSIQQNIDEYMKFYRNNVSHNIFPKLHFLEHHCTQWIDRWGFGMGMHGEQGVELVHSSIKKLEHQALGMRRAEDKLKVIMKSHLTQVCPTLHYLLPSAVKRGNRK